MASLAIVEPPRGGSPRLDGLMADVGANEGATALEVGRAAGRLEQVLSEFVYGYLEAKASQPGSDSIEARTLIIGVYRHHIKSICRWLEELVARFPIAIRSSD